MLKNDRGPMGARQILSDGSLVARNSRASRVGCAREIAFYSRPARPRRPIKKDWFAINQSTGRATRCAAVLNPISLSLPLSSLSLATVSRKIAIICYAPETCRVASKGITHVCVRKPRHNIDVTAEIALAMQFAGTLTHSTDTVICRRRK